MAEFVDARQEKEATIEEYHRIEVGDKVELWGFEFEVTKLNRTAVVLAPSPVDGAKTKRHMMARFATGKKL